MSSRLTLVTAGNGLAAAVLPDQVEALAGVDGEVIVMLKSGNTIAVSGDVESVARALYLPTTRRDPDDPPPLPSS